MQNIVKKDGFGFAFDPNACGSCNGACCRGESGYVWVNGAEIEAISSYLKMDSKQFIDEYLKKEGYRFTLKELKINDEYQCVFFDEKVGCEIYPVRPAQCREFPFWQRYRDDKNLSEVCRECKGILPL